MSAPDTPDAASRPEARLSRAHGDGAPAAPVRIVHLGLGNFFRAHQAWYTANAPDSADWGIAAFTGRSRDLADALTRQDGLYTLITRGPDGDACAVIGSVSRAHAGSEHAAWMDYATRPEVAIITLTVTEAGYLRSPGGGLDTEQPTVLADLAALRRDAGAPVATMPARLVGFLAARRAAGAGAIAVVPCDNLPDNGQVTARIVAELAGHLDPDLAAWIGEHVSFVTTMVDRITPATVPGDTTTVAELTGRADAAPVVTEPFTEWVLSGDFPAGRPAWQSAGARFVADVVPYEQRKLQLLNGGHSLLAYAGSARGHLTVAEAVTDPVCRDWLEQWWSLAGAHLTLPAADIAEYRSALLVRFGNQRIRHLLAQVAMDGSQKLPVRILPAVRAERARGGLPVAGLRILAAWLNHLRGAGAPIQDAAAATVTAAASGPLDQAARNLVALLDPDLAADRVVVAEVSALSRSLSAGGR